MVVFDRLFAEKGYHRVSILQHTKLYIISRNKPDNMPKKESNVTK